MLNCILGMVDKTKRALTILQQRNGLSCSPPPSGHTSSAPGSLTDPTNQLGSSHSQMPSPPAAAPSAASAAADPYQQQLRTKQSMNEILAATIRSTEERVVEVRRRAEEAVQEVQWTLYSNMGWNKGIGVDSIFRVEGRVKIANLIFGRFSAACDCTLFFTLHK